jgi:hypothetical protein
MVSQAEPGILYAIIPHAGLSGVSIAARVCSEELVLLWAQIGGLGDHDDLKLGVAAGSFKLGGGLAEAAAALEAELRRPIEVRAFYRDKDAELAKLEYWIELDGKLVRVGSLLCDRVRCWNLYLPWRVEKHAATFMDASPLSVSAPSGAQRWLTV